jgi:virginiamycin B lyase
MRRLVRLRSLALTLVAGCASSGRPTPKTLDEVQRPLANLPITTRISIPSSADWITFGFGSVWVVNYRPDRVSRIDASTSRLTADIPIGPNGCLGIVEAVDRIWVASCGDGRLNEIDPMRDSVVRRIPVPIRRGREGSFAFANGAFWIPDNVADSGSSSVAKVDALSGEVTAHVSTGARSDVAIAGFGSVWVASSSENVVVRIDPRRNSVIARIPVGGSPKFMAAGEGAIWVQNRGDGSVSRIDPSSNKEIARIEAHAPTRAGDIAAGGGAVWLSVDGKPVTRIDARTNAVTHQFLGGTGADAIRFGFGSVWVADHRVGELWRIDPKKM